MCVISLNNKSTLDHTMLPMTILTTRANFSPGAQHSSQETAYLPVFWIGIQRSNSHLPSTTTWDNETGLQSQSPDSLRSFAFDTASSQVDFQILQRVNADSVPSIPKLSFPRRMKFSLKNKFRRIRQAFLNSCTKDREPNNGWREIPMVKYVQRNEKMLHDARMSSDTYAGFEEGRRRRRERTAEETKSCYAAHAHIEIAARKF
jgi:hypothetical protein